jgi:hypothetical protein
VVGSCLAAVSVVTLMLLLARTGDQARTAVVPMTPADAVPTRCAVRVRGVSLTFVGANAAKMCEKVSGDLQALQSGTESALVPARTAESANSVGYARPSEEGARPRDSLCLLTSPNSRLLLIVAADGRNRVADRACVLFVAQRWHDAGQPGAEGKDEKG